MDVIRHKSVLNRRIKEAVFDYRECVQDYPIIITFCENIGDSTFEITIKKIDHEFFIDENGVKWVKQK